MPGPDLAAREAHLHRLAACTDPYLIGVRHHSPACAAAVPRLLDGFDPQVLLVELPQDYAPWLPWLAHPEARAPLALAAARALEGVLGFHPFADFSPEWQAIRWAAARGVEVVPCDLANGVLGGTEGEDDGRGGAGSGPGQDGGEPPAERDDGYPPSPLRRLMEAQGCDDAESLWDRLVESRAPGQQAEAVRRAALWVGQTLRWDAWVHGAVGERDRCREARMRLELDRARTRERVDGARFRVAAVVGAFHAAALLPESVGLDPVPRWNGALPGPDPGVVTSLVPYAAELLDSRSGYPAGVRDPRWHHRVWEALEERCETGTLAAAAIVEVCRTLRGWGHDASAAGGAEALRVARDLAALRDLPAPSRREVLEALETTLGQGESLGRGRVLARALQEVMVGHGRGQLAPGTPRSGLVPHVEGLMVALRLPGPDGPPPGTGGSSGRAPRRDDAHGVRLDPLRSDLDRRRTVFLERLVAGGVPYGERRDVDPTFPPALTGLTHSWELAWTPATDAALAVLGLRGVTLEQATAGALRAERTRKIAEEQWNPAARLEELGVAAACGLADMAQQGLRDLYGPFREEAGLADLVAALALEDRIRRGQVPGLPPSGQEGPQGLAGAVAPFAFPSDLRRSDLLAAGIGAAEGLAGSRSHEDAASLGELVRLIATDPESGLARLGDLLDRMARDGTPQMAGAAALGRVALGRATAESVGAELGSRIDGAGAPDGDSALAGWLSGALVAGAPQVEADPAFLAAAMERVARLSDEGFLNRLPALRHGFDPLFPAARERMLQEVGTRLGGAGMGTGLELDDDPADLASWAAADRGAAARLVVLGLGVREEPARGPARTGHPAPGVGSEEVPRETPPPGATPDGRPEGDVEHTLSPLDRWRLILGRQRERLEGLASRAAVALEDLYGAGRGEGSRDGPTGPANGGGAGAGAPFPTVRDWSQELEALFGPAVRDDVLARAAEVGRASILDVAEDSLQPSVELLERVLSLQGGLAEAHLPRLRRLVARVVDELVRALRVRVRPALRGLALPRPTRRPGGPLDLRRTAESSLRRGSAVPGADGPLLVPDRPVFRTRGRRSADWHVSLVVDVSGSMEPSTLYAAMMAAILHGMPSLSVRFVAFSTEVLDLSDRVSDPLGLLLEVRVGGGTAIHRGLRYAREHLPHPARSLVVLVTDFEEGGSLQPLLQEVRALRDGGARLLGLAALDDRAQPRFHRAAAEQVAAAGMPVAALTPLELARWVADQVR